MKGPLGMRCETVIYTCDVGDCPAEDAAPAAFSVDGAAYEIDLCARHRGTLTDLLAGFVASARPSRPLRSGLPRRGRGGSGRRGYDPARVRAWAQEAGFVVADRGRIPEPVLEAWRSRSSAA